MTKEEFSGGLDSMKCCGTNCPFSSWCEAEAVEMGYGANLNLPFPDFANRLMATNKTGWFPPLRLHRDPHAQRGGRHHQDHLAG